MPTSAGPPATPLHATGWVRVEIGTRRVFLVRRVGQNSFVYLPEAPRVARDGQARPRVALTLVLARMPVMNDASIAPLVTSGSLALMCTLAVDVEDAAALDARLNGNCAPFFIRKAQSMLRDDARIYVYSDILGAGAQWFLGASLPPGPALDVLHAFDRTASALRVQTDLQGTHAPIVLDVPIADLLGGVIDGLDRSLYVSMIVVNADGSSTPVPKLRRNLPDGPQMRGSPQAVPMLATGARLVSLPFAMTASVAAKPTAAALIVGGATSGGMMANTHGHVWVGNDAIASFGVNGSVNTPSEHYPMVTNPADLYWPDAIDEYLTWYAPTFMLVAPASGEDLADAAFAFSFAKTSAAIGAGGILQTGLTARLRLTVKQIAPTEIVAAFAAAKNPTLKAVPLQNLSCALEIPYRQAGSTAVLKQRLPGTITQTNENIVVEIDLLDDWVRLSYGALAYPPTASDMPSARIIIDFAFMSYTHIQIAGHDGTGIVGGGLHHPLPQVETFNELPAHILAPVVVRNELAIIGPTSTLQFKRESPGVIRDFSKIRLTTATLGSLHPELISTVPPQMRLITRTIIREETVDVLLPCTTYGNFYLQRDGASATAIGCQNSLKLGDTATHAFEEIPVLRDPAFRVYRSLQQPGRYLIVPAAYHVGRFGANAGDKAFRPILILYGVLVPDPSANRYALTATLIPDIAPSSLAKLTEKLTSYTPAQTTPSVIYPSDPFVGAKVEYTWTVPNGMDTPQAATVIDAINITVSIEMSDAALLTAMINNNGVQGVITFTLPDGVVMNAALIISGDISGPPESGPVPVTLAGATATLHNRTQQTMHVTDVVAVAANGATTTIAMDATLAPGATTNLIVGNTVVWAFADAQMATHPAIEELDIFVEDITTTVMFINQVNFANHKLTSLGVKSRLIGMDHVENVDLPEGKTASVSFTLPITSYLRQHTLQYALVETTADGSTISTWRDWDLNKGAVIGVTADQL